MNNIYRTLVGMIMVVLLLSPACTNEVGHREFLPGIITDLRVTQTQAAPVPAPIVGYGSAYAVDTTFSWASYPYAKRYVIQLSKDSQFITGIISQTAYTNHIVWETPLDFKAVYYWRVTAITGKGNTDWAQSSFTSGELLTTATNTVNQTLLPNTVTVADPPKIGIVTVTSIPPITTIMP
jgi:hypothetical protein